MIKKHFKAGGHQTVKKKIMETTSHIIYLIVSRLFLILPERLQKAIVLVCRMVLLLGDAMNLERLSHKWIRLNLKVDGLTQLKRDRTMKLIWRDWLFQLSVQPRIYNNMYLNHTSLVVAGISSLPNGAAILMRYHGEI